MLYKMQRGKWRALKTATKQTWPTCFCDRFRDREMLLAMNFGSRSILQGKMEAIWIPSPSSPPITKPDQEKITLRCFV